MTFVPAQMNIIASEGRLQIPQKEDTISCLIDLAMDWKAMPIQELLEHCRTGNEAALTELVKKISPVIHGVAYKSLRRYSINHGSIQNLVRFDERYLCKGAAGIVWFQVAGRRPVFWVGKDNHGQHRAGLASQTKDRGTGRRGAQHA